MPRSSYYTARLQAWESPANLRSRAHAHTASMRTQTPSMASINGGNHAKRLPIISITPSRGRNERTRCARTQAHTKNTPNGTMPIIVIPSRMGYASSSQPKTSDGPRSADLCAGNSPCGTALYVGRSHGVGGRAGNVCLANVLLAIQSIIHFSLEFGLILCGARERPICGVIILFRKNCRPKTTSMIISLCFFFAAFFSRGVCTESGIFWDCRQLNSASLGN